MERIRHWRAEKIADFIGAANAGAVREVRHAARERSVYVVLFLGPTSAGKTTLARWLMRSYCCAAPDRATADPCGRCEGCLHQGVEYSREVHVGRHWEIDCTGNVGRKEVAEIIAEARYEEAPRLYFDEVHRLSKRSAQHPLLKFAEDLRAGLLVASAVHDPSAVSQNSALIPELWSRLHKVYLVPPTADEMVEFFGRKAVEWNVVAPEPLLRQMVVRSGRNFRACLDCLDTAAATPTRTLVAEALDTVWPKPSDPSEPPPVPLW